MEFSCSLSRRPGQLAEAIQNVQYAHTDYPMSMPSINAFFMRLLSENDMVIPFTLAISVALAIPSIIYLQLSQRNLE